MLTTTTKEDIDKMIVTGKVKLSGWKLFYHYVFAGFLFLIPILTTWQLLKYYVFDSYSGKLTPAIIARGYIILPFAILMYFFLRSRLRLKKMKQ